MSPRLVLVASSLSRRSDEVVAVAARAAQGGRLELVHVVELAPGAEEGPPEFRSGPGDWLELLHERASRALHAQAKRLDLDPTGYAVAVVFGSPVSALARHVRQRSPWLTVVGASDGQGGPRRSGALACRLAHEARCATLVVRAGRAFPPHRVVVGVDFSAPARAALERAAELAVLDGCTATEVECVHALHLDPWAALLPGGRRRAETEALSRVRHLAAAAAGPRAVPARSTILVGPPAERLLEHVERTAPDLVALGTTGYRSVDPRRRASAAERLVRESSASVLFVPPGVAPSAESPRSHPRLRGNPALDSRATGMGPS